jgi:peptidoglycan/LPS O-acetylase OafA/YrhL
MMTRIASLDTVRGLAAWGVAIPHFFIFHHLYAEQFEPLAILGVELFFILSGFVLAPQILQCAQAVQRRRFGIFLIRRWMRTIPPYIVALIVATILFENAWSADFIRYATYTQNLFAQENANDYYSVAWSLSIEEWFYVIFPIYLFISVRLVGSAEKPTIVLCAISFIVIVSCVRLAFGDNSDWGPSVRRVVVFRVDSIAYGFLLYCYAAGPGALLIQRVWLTAFAFFAIALGIFSFFVTDAIADGALSAKITYPFLAAAFACSCLPFALKANAGIANSRILRTISLFGGRISYSVYLFHIIFLALIGAYLKDRHLILQFVLYLGSTGTFACIFFKFFEQPILLVRPKFEAESHSLTPLKEGSPLTAAAREL